MLLARRLPRLMRKLDKVELTISSAASNSTSDMILSAERAIMQIQIEWELFVRNLILDSATGQYKNSSGSICSNSFGALKSREIAAYKLVSLYPRRQTEPDWYLPTQAIDAALRLNISNFSNVSAELGLTPWPIDDLRHIRNFIAHRSKRSALSLRSTNLASQSSKIDVFQMSISYTSGGVPRYKDWINFIRGSSFRLVN